jgi:hypothetical protein
MKEGGRAGGRKSPRKEGWTTVGMYIDSTIK